MSRPLPQKQAQKSAKKPGYAFVARLLGAFLFYASGILTLFVAITGQVYPTHASGPDQNRIIAYQLRLTDAGGTPVADGTKNIKISFYAAASGGTPIHSDCGTTGSPVARKVVFVNGIGTVLIGDTAASGTTNCVGGGAPNTIDSDGVLFNNTSLYLGITVDPDVAEMTPRKRIVSIGWAQNADRIDDYDSLDLFRTTAHAIPAANTTYDLGSVANRFRDLFLGPDSLHIGTSATDEATIVYQTTPNILSFSTDSSSNGDIAFQTDDLYLKKSNGFVGVNTTAPGAFFDVRAGATSEHLRLTDSTGSDSIGLFVGSGSPETVVTAQIGSQYFDRTGGATYIKATGDGTNTGWAQLSSGLSGLGAAGRVTFWSGTSTLSSNTNLFWDDAASRLGINTTTPATALDVNGVINAATGYRVAAGAASGNYLRGNGTNFVSSAIQTSDITGAGGVTGAGTATRVAFWSGASALSSNANLYWDDTNSRLGIGTATPGERLTIRDTSKTVASGDTSLGIFTTDSQAVDLGGAIALGGTYTGSSQTNFGNIWGRKENSTDGNTSGYLAFGTRGPPTQERMRIASTGNVGVGTTAPGQMFSVGSNTFQVNSSGNLVKINNVPYSWPASQGAASTSLVNDGAGNLSWSSVGPSSAGGWTDDGTVVRLSTSTDNVGIGTASPVVYAATQSRLDVTDAAALLVLSSTTAENGANLAFRNSSASNKSAMIGLVGTGGTLESSLGFYTGGTATTLGTENMRLTAAGSLGIGTTGPDRALDVLHASSPQLRLTRTDGTVYGEFLVDGSGDLTTALTGDEFKLDEHIRFPTDNSFDIGASGTTRPRTVYLGTSAVTGSTTLASGSLTATGALTLNANTSGGADDLIFQTAGATKMTILENGNVGVNTTSPDAFLDIESAEDTEHLRLTDSTAADSVGLYIGTGSPESAVTAQLGSQYFDRSGGAAYIKASGDNTNTGWTIFTTGGGGFTGSGSTNKVAKFTGATALGDSSITDDGTSVSVGAVGTDFFNVITSNAAAKGATIRNTNTGASAKTFLAMGNDADVTSGIQRNSSFNADFSGTNSLNIVNTGSYAIGMVTGGTLRTIIMGNGNVGIGDDIPDDRFTVGASSQFRVGPTGNILRVNDVPYSWPASQGVASSVLQNDGSGGLSWSTQAVAASVSLSNLSSVAINTALLPGADNTIDLGSAAFRWNDLYLGPSSLKISSTTGTGGAGADYTEGSISFSTTNLKIATAAVGAGVAGSVQLTTAANAGVNVSSTGNVAIGNTSPSAVLGVGTSNQFTVGASGDIDSSGIMSLAIALASNPAYTFTGDLDTGVFSPGANNIAVSTGGSERLRIDSSGNVGIGDSSPTAPLTVGSGDAFTVSGAGLVTTASTLNSVRSFVGNGTDANPSFAFTNSVGTGLYRAGIDIMGISTAGVERIRVNADGTIGIGSAGGSALLAVGSAGQFAVSASGDLSKVNNVPYVWPSSQGAASTFLQNNGTGTLSWVAAHTGSGSSGQVVYWTGASTQAGSSSFFWDATNGRLGIGSTTPAAMLHLESVTPYMIMRGDSTAGAVATVKGQRSGGSLATPSAVGSSVNLLALQAMGYDGSAFQAGSEIDFPATQTWSGTARGSAISFSTVTDSTTSQVERMRIDQSGFVGIGMTAPTTALDLSGALTVREMSAPALSAADTGRIYFDATANKFKVSENGGSYSDLFASSAGGWTDNGAIVRLTTDSDRVGLGEDPDGDVKFQVAGKIKSSVDGFEFPDGSIMTTATGATGGVSNAGDTNIVADNESNGVGAIILSTTGAERLRVQPSTGNVGIGDTTPASLLTVGALDAFQVDSSGNAYVTEIQVSGSTPGTGYTFRGANGQDDGMYFISNQNYGWAVDNVEVMRMSNGNLGIGDASPAAMLTVGDGDDFQVSSTGTMTTSSTAQALEFFAGGSTPGTGYTFSGLNGQDDGMFYISNQVFGWAYDNIEGMRFASGNLSIGSTSTPSMFNVGSANQFQVSGTGLVSTTNTVQGLEFFAGGSTPGTGYTFSGTNGQDDGMFYISNQVFGWAYDNVEGMRFASGNLSIGSTSTTSMFNVGTSNQFQVNSAGLVSTTSTIQGLKFFVGGSGAGSGYTFSGSGGTDDGMFFVGNDVYGWATGGVEQMRMASGSLSIGSTSTPSMFNVGSANQFQVSSTGLVSTTNTIQGLKLFVGGSGAGSGYTFSGSGGTDDGMFYISNDVYGWATGGTEAMRMSSGNLSIGSVSTTSMFNVGTSNAFQVNSSGAMVTTSTAQAAEFFAGGTTAGTGYTFSGSGGTDDGMFWPSNDVIAWALSGVEGMRFTGNLGIGDSTPTEATLVVGSAGAGNIYATFATANTERLCWDAVGASLISDCTGTPGDYAEEYGTSDAATEAGDIVATDPNREAEEIIAEDGNPASKAWVAKATSSTSNLIIGVVSTKPNEVIGQNFTAEENPRPVALNGRVPVKVNTENGPIAIGDPITVSSVAGVGAKATLNGRVIGYALESYAGAEQGKIMVFMNVGWWNGVEVQSGNGSSETVDIAALSHDLDLNGHSILSVHSIQGMDGAWSIDENGLLKVKEIHAEKIRAKSLEVEADADMQTIGQGVIQVGNSSVVIENAAIKPDTRIFVTFYGPVEGSWWISRREYGKFEISLTKDATTDLQFEYWLLGVVDNRPAPSPEPVPAPVDEPAPEPTMEPVAESAPESSTPSPATEDPVVDEILPPAEEPAAESTAEPAPEQPVPELPTEQPSSQEESGP